MDLMSLDDIEKELYGQKPRTVRVNADTSHHDEQKNGSTSMLINPWREEKIHSGDPEPVKKAEKIGSRVFIGLAAVLVVLVGFAGYYLYQYFTTKDARFSVEVPAEVKIGEPFIITAVFENISKKSLYEPVIAMQLPEGAIFVDNPAKRVIEESITDTAPGDSVKRDYAVVLVGIAYQTYRFSAEASYRYGESTLSSKFQKEATASVVARNPVVSLDVTVPTSVVNGQDFELQARYKNETDAVLKNIAVQFDLPQNFSLNNSDPKLDANSVLLEELAAHEEGIIIVSGFLTESANAFVPFGAKAVLAIGGATYEIASRSNSISVTASPLVVSISSDQKDAVAYPGEDIKFVMHIRNNASVPLREVIARVRFEGDYFNLASIQGKGSLNDSDRSYEWTAARVSELRELETGQSIELPFTVSLRQGYAPGGIALKDTEVRAVGMVTSETVPPELTAQQTIGTNTYVVKIGGTASVIQTVYFAEPSSEIKNTGIMPPQVGQPTTFTIHWKINAQGSSVQQVRVQAALGRGMSWTGKLSVKNTQSAPRYNAQTEEIIWELESAQAGSPAPEAIFQLSFVPSSNMAGNQYEFLEDIVFSATDAFTGKKIGQEFRTLDSRDIADANALQKGYDKVRQ